MRRSCHCRNCGVLICKECAVVWPAKMIPDTYNFKKENSVNVCPSCDWLSHSFRLSLLEGHQDKSVAIYATGNINLHAPFGNVKGELLYPVHCSVLGGSLNLLKWLVEENCCPIKSLRVSGSGQSGTYTPIVTSKGRSLLGIAMENRRVDIIRYLVVRKGISLAGEQDITFEMLLRNLDIVLRLLPEDATSPRTDHSESTREDSDHPSPMASIPPISQRPFDAIENSRSLSEEAQNLGAVEPSPNHHDDCKCLCTVLRICVAPSLILYTSFRPGIICFDSKIDCVATPCGHQMCCLKCSEHFSRCPVCSADCTFLRVFKA
jgi:hypothetical protein